MVPIESAIEAYHLNTGQYPAKLEDLVTCPEGNEGSWHGPYLKERQLYDPWDRSFIYEPNSTDTDRYVIISYGEDGMQGGDGYGEDIYNR